MSSSVAVIGGGPAGLMAAETLSDAGLSVDLYDAMPSVGRKFLLAGRGGLNLTHSEPREAFASRYGERAGQIQPWLAEFDASALREWAHGLGIETFTGSSGRVFPREMKAAPLLRRWLQRLRATGVIVHARHRWKGWDGDGSLVFDTPQGEVTRHASAVVLALGGGSWPRLGSDGAWQAVLKERGVDLAPLLPSNGGFKADWSPYFANKFAGQALKGIAMAPQGHAMRKGECLITATGMEGGLVYAWSSVLRDAIMEGGSAIAHIDLLPTRDLGAVREQVMWPRGSRSWSSHLGSRLGLKGAKLGLLRERVPADKFNDPDLLAAAIKHLPICLVDTQPLEEAISSAGGVSFQALDRGLMLVSMPGVFCAGEMLDWEAPTGGYLLTACFASGRIAGKAVKQWLDRGSAS